MKTKKVFCEVCKEMSEDDNKFICSPCMDRWRKSIRNQALKDFVEKCEKYTYFNELLVVDWFRITEIAKQLGAKDGN
jgi:predicted RNA-binding protein